MNSLNWTGLDFMFLSERSVSHSEFVNFFSPLLGADLKALAQGTLVLGPQGPPPVGLCFVLAASRVAVRNVRSEETMYMLLACLLTSPQKGRMFPGLSSFTMGA